MESRDVPRGPPHSAHGEAPLRTRPASGAYLPSRTPSARWPMLGTSQFRRLSRSRRGDAPISQERGKLVHTGAQARGHGSAARPGRESTTGRRRTHTCAPRFSSAAPGGSNESTAGGIPPDRNSCEVLHSCRDAAGVSLFIEHDCRAAAVLRGRAPEGADMTPHRNPLGALAAVVLLAAAAAPAAPFSRVRAPPAWLLWLRSCAPETQLA